MRRVLLLAASLIVLGNAGCFLNEFSSNPITRMNELITESENLRQAHDAYLRFWMADQPCHLTPDRTDGGVR